MYKYVAFYILTLAIVAVIAVEFVLSDASEAGLLYAVASNVRETEQKVAAHRRFRAVLDPTIAGLLQREIRLKDACAQVYDVARFDSPSYVHMLPETDPGATLHEQVARNLLGHVSDHVEYLDIRPSPMPELEAELREMIAAVESTNPK